MMTITLQEVKILNFRSIKKMQVTLDPAVTVLVGANNTGKTNFLRALQIALGTNHPFIGKEDIFIAKDEILPKERAAIIDILLVPHPDGEFNEVWVEHWGNAIQGQLGAKEFVAIRTRIRYDSDHLRYVTEQCLLKKWPNTDPSFWEKTALPRKLREVIPLEFIDAQRDIYEDIRNRSSFWGRIVADLPLAEPEVKEIESILNDINERIINTSDGLKQVKKKLELLNQTISHSDKGVSITPITRKLRDLNRGIDIHFQSEGSESFPLSYHGMGTRSWSSLLIFNAFISHQVDKNNPYHPLLALEEPESHLHPHAQRHVFDQMENIPGQKIVSTHSPYIASAGRQKSSGH